MNGDSRSIYELYAIRYASRVGRRSECFLGGDPNDGPMPIDYFAWLAVSGDEKILIDTGFPETPGRSAVHQRPVWEAIGLLGLAPEDITHVIVTHLHFDHAGGLDRFPRARFHVQEREMTHATGRHMGCVHFNKGYVVQDVVSLVRLVHAGRTSFYDGGAAPLPGIRLHRIGGHTPGTQCVEVLTQRGWVVIASDACHFYENFETGRPHRSVVDTREMFDGFARLKELGGDDRMIPGHDPRVMAQYPAYSKETAGIIARLDVAPAR